MSNYQKQVDIDALYDLIWNAETNSVRFASKVSNEKLTNDLTNLRRNLVSFNDLLMKFNGDSTGLAQDLTTFKGNLNTFLTSIDTFQTDLDEFRDELTDFDVALNGDEETGDTGFVGLLDTFENYVYGKGEQYYDEETQTYKNCTPDHPSESSLKGMLNALNKQIADMDEGDTKLALSLSKLSGYLTSFKGTLEELRAKIIHDHGVDYFNQLDEEAFKLIGSITSANNDISDHKQTLDETKSLIGTKNDSASDQQSQGKPVTVYGKLNDTTTTATATSEKATELTNIMYKGTGTDHDESATPEEPADGSLINGMNKLEVDIDGDESQGIVGLKDQTQNLDNKIGTAPTSTSDGTGILGKIGTAPTSTSDGKGILGDVGKIQKITYKGDSGTGTVDYPTSDSLMGQVDTVKENIGTVDIATDGSLQSQVFNLKSLADVVVQVNKGWQLLWIGATDSHTLNDVITMYGVKLANIHYAYHNNNYYVNDGSSWVQYDTDIIEDTVEFESGVCNSFNSDVQSIAENLDLIRVYDLSQSCFYEYSTGSWNIVTSMDYYNKVTFATLFNAVSVPYGSELSTVNLHSQTEVNHEIYNQISNKQDKLSKTTSSATAYTTNIDSGTFNLSKYGNLVILDFDFTHKMNSSDVSLDRMVANGIPSEYRPSGTIGTSVNGLRTSNYDSSYFHYVYVNTDGQVRTTFKVTNGYSIRVRGQLMWIV